MAIKETDLAWLAGVIDSSSSTYTHKNGNGRVSYRLAISMKNDKKSLMDRISSLTGAEPVRRDQLTPPHTEERMRRGCVDHCPEAHIHVAYQPRNSGRITLSAVRCYVVLWNVYAFLSEGSKYDHILDDPYWAGRGPGKKVCKSMMELGWEMPELPEELA